MSKKAEVVKPIRADYVYESVSKYIRDTPAPSLHVVKDSNSGRFVIKTCSMPDARRKK